MPELPEVESIRQSLIPLIQGKEISALEVLHPDVFENPFNYNLRAAKIERLSRSGKYLQIHLSNGCFLLIHLRMTGKLLYHEELEEIKAHTHLRFTLKDADGKNSYLDYNDVRRFGRVGLYRDKSEVILPGFRALGPDALAADFSSDYLYAQAKRYPKRPIKALLLDQTIVAGLGNIYCDEALFRAGIHPKRASGRISKARIEALFAEIKPLLLESIGLKGTSFSDYVDGLGKKGSFIEKLKVYGKKGEPCPNCGRPLLAEQIAGRTTVFCPRCQR
ncbi:MAG: bifunctional DNA-formamidopyrimidine glycosylase/DNA-(apurinic or apyrimidinic site) lyase [Eubacteriales bacterium]|nr:bifunctional DNA-formamidopyrimidine glycosylase/DNA-(apurinic or apyrimidinic site) lyase [Eubacteriales bacterium]